MGREEHVGICMATLAVLAPAADVKEAAGL